MDAEQNAPANPLLAKAGQALLAAAENEGCWPLVYRWLKRLTWWTVAAYCAGLLLLQAALRWVGELNPTTAFLLYLPPSLWWLPALPLAFLALLLHRRALLLLLAVLAWFCYAFLGWRQGRARPEAGPTLTLMTYNRGQHMNQSLQPFKALTHPDLIVMQEAAGRAAGYAQAPEYAEFKHARSLGEFTLLSRYPVLEERLVPAAPGREVRAARFVIDWQGRQVAVYAVHLQTPRDVLMYQMRGAFLYGVIGWPGTPWEDNRLELQTFWDGQIADARAVLDAVRADPLPALVAGDFNAPHMGHIHDLIIRELGDAHAAAGAGFGFSFPGTTRNPLSAGGPWMRIDYVFHSRHWQALNCTTEASRPSQHRAVAATLRLSAP